MFAITVYKTVNGCKWVSNGKADPKWDRDNTWIQYFADMAKRGFEFK